MPQPHVGQERDLVAPSANTTTFERPLAALRGVLVASRSSATCRLLRPHMEWELSSGAGVVVPFASARVEGWWVVQGLSGRHGSRVLGVECCSASYARA